MRLLPYGPRAVLAEFDTIDEVMASAAAWRTAAWPSVIDIVPAARTVLVVHDGSLDISVLEPSTESTATVEADPVEIIVAYDGPDLESVAATIGCSTAEVVALHSAPMYRVAFCGFMPGFAYMVGAPAELHLPRLSTPRERVPAGSVAVAGGYSGIYPRESPGGWHLLGRAECTLWDERRPVPALLPPGARVKFVPS
jgi:KipI family sensor histidine kinase inhibitor